MSYPPAQAAPAVMPSQTGAEEASALRKVMWFGIVQLVGLVAGWIGGFYAFTTVFSNLTSLNLPSNATPQQVADSLGPLFQAITYIIPLALGITLAGLVVLTMGFRGLARVDRARFGISTPFMIVFIVGLLIVGAGAIPLLASIPSIISNAPATGATPGQPFINVMSSVLAYIGLILIGGVLSLIGLIGGLILGLWRVGSRYNQTVIKIGAIFEIIPLLNVVAPILIILGANEAKNAVSR